MNYKVAKTTVALCVIYLTAFYILKFKFPELFLQSITSPTLLTLGRKVSSSIVLTYAMRMLLNFITFYLFKCACSGSFKLTLNQLIIMLSFVVFGNLIADFRPELYTHTSIVFMLTISLLSKGVFKYTVISFTIHGYLSQFLASVRGFETIILQINEIGALASFVLAFEGYVWLIFLAVLFYMKEGKKNECSTSTVHQQTRGEGKEDGSQSTC